MKNQKKTVQKEKTKKGLNKHDLASIANKEKNFNKGKIVTK